MSQRVGRSYGAETGRGTGSGASCVIPRRFTVRKCWFIYEIKEKYIVLLIVKFITSVSQKWNRILWKEKWLYFFLFTWNNKGKLFNKWWFIRKWFVLYNGGKEISIHLLMFILCWASVGRRSRAAPWNHFSAHFSPGQKYRDIQPLSPKGQLKEPSLHVYGLWREAGVTGEKPRGRRENMLSRNQRTFLLWATLLTTLSLRHPTGNFCQEQYL